MRRGVEAMTGTKATACGLLLALMLVGCDERSEVPDAGAMDSGAVDSGAVDSGAVDSGSTDSGSIDAGADSGLDAAAMDAGFDAGEDGGPEDAGSDAGEPDAGPTACGVPGGDCDVALQDCPTDYACYFAEVGGVSSTRCELLFDPSDPGVDGDLCEFADDCAPGLTCRAGTCREYCCPDGGDGCPVGQSCVHLFEAPNLGHCAPAGACALVPNSGCTSTQGCYPGPTPGEVGCFGAGSLPEGTTCAAVNQCEPGTTCLDLTGGGFECVLLCQLVLGGSECTVAAHECVALGDYLPEGVGACAIPDA